MFKQSFLLSIILVLFLYTSVCAQDEVMRNDTVHANDDMPKTISTKVSMEIDKKLYPVLQGNIFISPKPRAIIMPMVLRSDFESINRDTLLEATAKELNVTIKKKGTITKKGKRAHYLIGTTNDKSRNVMVEVYYLKADEYRTIMITGFYDYAAKSKYKKTIKKAAFSAQLDE